MFRKQAKIIFCRRIGLTGIFMLGIISTLASGGGGGGGDDTEPPDYYELTATTEGNGTGTVTSLPAGIDCGSDCSEDYESNTIVTLTATPDAGSVFAGWSGDCSGTGSCIVTMDAAKSVAATFDIQQFSLTVTSAGTGTGAVTSSPSGIDCGSDCSENYQPNTEVTLTATPATGSLFTGWSGDCTGTGSCVVTMDTAKSITATFDVQLFTLTVTNSGTGTGLVTSSPAGLDCSSALCTTSFPYGTAITLTATPDSGSLFAGFSGGCASITTTCTVTLLQDTSLTADFNTTIISAAHNQLGLNGVDDVAVFDESNSSPETTLDVTTFTIEAWIYPLASQEMLVVADSAYYLMVKPDPLRVEFAAMTTTGFPAFQSFAGTSSPLQLNQWNHVAGIADNSTQIIHVAVNGELSDPLVMGGSIDASFYQLFSVGNSYPSSLGDYPFIGRIDEVRLSSAIRYDDDYPPLSLFIPDSDTLGLWHFDETEGSTSFADASGNGISLIGLNGAKTVSGNREVINYAPVANAGDDKNYLTGSTVTLDGSESYDLNSDPLTFSWTLNTTPIGSSASLTGDTTSSPSFTTDLDGEYIITLEVNDGSLPSPVDTVTITALTPGAPIAPLPDTGQTACYDASGSLITCAGSGQDGEYPINPMSFSDNADGTISDDITGLTWQKCTVGTNNDASCSGTSAIYNWYEASGTYDETHNPGTTDVCGSLSLGGYTDWRLPEISQLFRIADYSTHTPAINTTYFPNTITGIISFYWSSTSYPSLYDNTWGVAYIDGRVTAVDKVDIASFSNVRCVRGSASHAHSFLDNGDGTITDINTGLMWQQEDDDTTRTWEEALAYCEGVTLASYTDWRLPNIKALDSIVDVSKQNPAINSIYFYGTDSSYYWSSTNSMLVTDTAHNVNFLSGSSGRSSKTNVRLTRCVR
jgi:hypothetical protein